MQTPTQPVPAGVPYRFGQRLKHTPTGSRGVLTVVAVYATDDTPRLRIEFRDTQNRPADLWDNVRAFEPDGAADF